jgi:hypothetical protein
MVSAARVDAEFQISTAIGAGDNPRLDLKGDGSVSYWDNYDVDPHSGFAAHRTLLYDPVHYAGSIVQDMEPLHFGTNGSGPKA